MERLKNFDDIKNDTDEVLKQSRIFLDKLLEQARKSMTETAFFINIYKGYIKASVIFLSGFMDN